MTLAERYERLCATPSSINEHLPTLRQYAERCESVAEFGVDIGQSTTAFLMAHPKSLVSVDVVRKPELRELIDASDSYLRFEVGSSDCVSYFGDSCWTFRLSDSKTFELGKVDLLFIDSSHWYEQMKSELETHHFKVKRWIICHDTIAYGEYGEAGPPQVGILPAIEEFLSEHPEWTRLEHRTNNNGLLVLERANGNHT